MEQQGVLFCHGHSHTKQTNIVLPENIEWTMVDIKEDTKPDIVGDYQNVQTLQQLGFNKYDYVVEVHCPIYNSIDKIVKFLISAYQLLRHNGQAIINSILKDIIIKNKNLHIDPNINQDIDILNTEILDFFQGERPQYVQELDKIMHQTGFQSYDVKEDGSVIFLKIVLRGVMFCHGHTYDIGNKQLDILKSLPSNIKWTMVDIDRSVNPDLVGDYRKEETLQQLGLNTYDYVLEAHCSIHYALWQSVEFLKSAFQLLKQGGRAIILNLILDIANVTSTTPTYKGEKWNQKLELFFNNQRPEYNIILERIKEASGFSYIDKIDRETGDVTFIK